MRGATNLRYADDGQRREAYAIKDTGPPTSTLGYLSVSRLPPQADTPVRGHSCRQ
jgi:hypothetical protein